MCDKTVVEALAVYLPVQGLLDRLDELLTLAELTYDTHPAEVKRRVGLKPEGTSAIDVALALSSMRPDERRNLQDEVTRAKLVIEKVIENVTAAASISTSARDLGLVHSVLRSLPKLGSRSKREAERYFDAVEAGDSGVMIAVLKPGQKVKIEVRFLADLPDELRDTIGLN